MTAGHTNWMITMHILLVFVQKKSCVSWTKMVCRRHEYSLWNKIRLSQNDKWPPKLVLEFTNVLFSFFLSSAKNNYTVFVKEIKVDMILWIKWVLCLWNEEKMSSNYFCTHFLPKTRVLDQCKGFYLKNHFWFLLMNRKGIFDLYRTKRSKEEKKNPS